MKIKVEDETLSKVKIENGDLVMCEDSDYYLIIRDIKNEYRLLNLRTFGLIPCTYESPTSAVKCNFKNQRFHIIKNKDLEIHYKIQDMKSNILI